MSIKEDVRTESKKRPSPAKRRRAASDTLKVLMLSHMDPRLSRGGAEIAAFQLYEELLQRDGVKAWFLACAPGKIQPKDGVVLSQPFGEGSYLYGSNAGHAFDHFNFSNPDDRFPEVLAELLMDIQPDVVHLHHYTNFGVETLYTIRRTLPDAKIVMTLHEYLAICNHFGQMVKRPSFRLCEQSGPRECNQCFPERSPQDFFMRELFLKRFFRLVDQFISPSHFLSERYAQWGIDADRIAVIENGVPDLERRGTLPYPDTDDGLVFGFFGQISRLKGINVLFDAAAELVDEKDIRIEIHGDYSSQPEEFQREFQERLKDAPPNLVYMGPYDNRHVDRLMQSVHAVLVPSIWWENSPLVIQEAFANRRPLICSDIGGMAEKIRDGIDGFHFQAGNGRSLAAVLKKIAREPKALNKMPDNIIQPKACSETADTILETCYLKHE
ncbi:MAG: glycosyltransferase family 4 protein [Sphingobium sp.]|nr:glycosyltransferase family 4 protein [Sphingobium sp.]MCP5398984.1 glycosyltransferase family 4 protein [Sphingomonas sp.]